MEKILISLLVFLLPMGVEAQRHRLTNQTVQEVTTPEDDQEEEITVQEQSEDQEADDSSNSENQFQGRTKEERTLLARWPGWHDYLRCFIVDTVDVWKNLFSQSSMHVMSALIPLYLSTRQANQAIHNKFYDPLTHENVKQPSKFLREIAVADALVAIPFVAFNAYGWWFSKDPNEFRRVQVFNAGLISTLLTKYALKGFKHGDSYRPWNEEFPCDTQADNGWPSGHAAMIAYLATYWGLEKGYRWGVPLGIFTVYAMAINVVTNHHYISQVFVGAGLGVVFGVSAHKTFQHLADNEDLFVGLGADVHGNPALRIAYDF
jgi:membrane-associated phospholipid phosphatase